MFSAAGIEVKIKITNGRYFIECPAEKSNIGENILSRVIGISGWAETIICEKTVDEVIASCIEEGKKLSGLGIKTFKIEARRTDKSFPVDSYGLRCRAGEAVAKAVDGLKVDVPNPQDIIQIEIRDKAYIYSGGKKGLAVCLWDLPERGFYYYQEGLILLLQVFLWPPAV
jgi:thiamine biosynthesis protein ThiI